MSEFKEVPASIHSLTMRRLILGVGINDAEYMISYRVDGRMVRCPFYAKWADMMKRGHSDAHKANHSAYKDCTVDARWHRFSAFKMWMEKQDWRGKELDKDLLLPGNKVYSPETCCFISKETNNALRVTRSKHSDFPPGVSVAGDRYKAELGFKKFKKHIGCFDTQEEAGSAYRIHKARHLRNLA